MKQKPEMQQHMMFTLLRAYRWAAQHRAIYGGDCSDYSGYVVCYEAMAAIEAELKRRDRRAWSRWVHAPVGTAPDSFYRFEGAQSE
jgi:hypothetical protein